MTIKTKITALALCVLLLGGTLVGCGGGGGESGGSGNGDSATPESNDTAPQELTFDTPFDFDDLTITLGSDITTTVLENQFSDHDGKTVIIIPVTVVNNKDTTHSLNLYYHKTFGPSGTELPTISTYFTDTDIDFAGDIRSGATQETLMHIVYDGDGDYYMEFATLVGEPTEVKLPITLA